MSTSLIFELSKNGKRAYSLPPCDVPEIKANTVIDAKYLRKNDADLPQVSEVDVIRHFVALSELNYGVDSGFYPLGSCTMKYNPKVNEVVARYEGFSQVHPLQDEETVQGALELMYETERQLAKVSGMDGVSLQPAAGAHGELTGLMVIKAYHEHNNQSHKNKIIVPDSAHGTNPASAVMAGFEVVEITTNEKGNVDIDALHEAMDDNIAGLMLTNPSTLGLFENDIVEIADIVHKSGGLLYYDGANMNAIMGITSPGIMGFDVMHFNLHKTFSTPHGGGGPGAGPIGVKKELIDFLPAPIIAKKDDTYYLDYDRPLSIGKVKAFYGNFGVIVRAYSYILTMGDDGLRAASENAVLNANYMKSRLEKYYKLSYDRICMHEFVLAGLKENPNHIHTLDIAKRLLDYGYHPPTIYFPLIVDEAIMIEPTETESKDTLDEFIDALIKIAIECKDDPEMVKSAPHNTPVRRLDEAGAARKPIVNCCNIR